MLKQVTRIREIDFCRGIAIILMIAFHSIVDLTDFFNFTIPYDSGFWYYEGKFSAILFIFLSGLSRTLGRNTPIRGLLVLACALLITAITYFYNPVTYIRFGILHLLGSSMLLYYFIPTLSPNKLLFSACLLLLLGRFFEKISVTSSYLIPFGLTAPSFVSLDYYPLIPWFGLFLCGIAIGKLLYKPKYMIFYLPNHKIITAIEYLGKHSLLIYLCHQPIILLLLYLVLSII